MADQLWLMTRIREEEEDEHQNPCNIQLSLKHQEPNQYSGVRRHAWATQLRHSSKELKTRNTHTAQPAVNCYTSKHSKSTTHGFDNFTTGNRYKLHEQATMITATAAVLLVSNSIRQLQEWKDTDFLSDFTSFN